MNAVEEMYKKQAEQYRTKYTDAIAYKYKYELVLEGIAEQAEEALNKMKRAEEWQDFYAFRDMAHNYGMLVPATPLGQEIFQIIRDEDKKRRYSEE